MRRTGAIFGVLALVTALAGCWVQPGYDAARSHWNPGEDTLTLQDIGGLTELWDTPLPTAVSVNAPISVGDAVYATSTQDVAAVDAATGALRWSRDLDDEEVGFLPDLGAPVWHRGAVLVPAAAVARFGTVTRLDPADGTTIDTAGGLAGAVFELAVADDQVAVSSGQLGSSRIGTAMIDWTYDPSTIFSFGGAYPSVHFAIVDDRIQWSYGSVAQGYSAACPPHPVPLTGCAPDWSTPLGGDPAAPAGVGATEVVYGDDTGTVTVLDTASGAVRWRAEAGSPIRQAAAVTDQAIVVATDDGRVLAYPAAGCGAATCAPLWVGPIGGPAATAPVVAGDVVYAATEAGTVDAFGASGCGQPDCPPLVRVEAGSPITGGPIVHDGRVVVGTADGHLIAFGPG